MTLEERLIQVHPSERQLAHQQMEFIFHHGTEIVRFMDREKVYDDFFCKQFTELLTNYGEIFSVWFDGACGEGPNGKKQFYDFERYYALIYEGGQTSEQELIDDILSTF